MSTCRCSAPDRRRTMLSLVSRTTDPVAERITIRLVAEGTEWLETTITVPHEVKRIDIANRLLKIATSEKESVYFAFPFAVSDDDPEYEITGGVTSLDTPHVPGSAQHMFAIRHWLGLQDANGAAAWATLEAPLIELGSIALPYAPFPQTVPVDRAKRSTIYSWALNNLWDTNFPPAQGGEMYFRYALSSDVSRSRRELGIQTGASLSTPLVGICLRRGEAEVGDASGSFISVSHPLVEVVTVAQSRTGSGLVAFLQSLASETVESQISFPNLQPISVKIANHLERHPAELTMVDGKATVNLAPGAYVGVIVETTKR